MKNDEESDVLKDVNKMLKNVVVLIKAEHTTEQLMRMVPLCSVLALFFDIKYISPEEGTELTMKIKELGGSDAVLSYFCSLQALPDSGVFSAPLFQFDLKEIQGMLPMLVGSYEQMLTNQTTLASLATQDFSLITNNAVKLNSEHDNQWHHASKDTSKRQAH